MTTLAVNRSIQSQATLPSNEIEGLITQLPPELVESCLFWTDLPGKENARLVCRSWNTLTLTASKNPEQPDLNEFIRLLMKNLRKSHPRKMGQLTVIKTMLGMRVHSLVAPAPVQRLFVFTKGCIIGVLKKLSSTRKELLQKAIGPEIPPSLNSLFDLAEMSLDEAMQTRDFATFHMVFIGHLELSERSRGRLVIDAAKAGQFRMLQVLLNSGQISIANRELALGYVAEDVYEDCAQLLLNHGPISVNGRGTLLDIATSQDYPAIARLLLAHGSITAEACDWAVENAMDRGNHELAQFIRDSAVIPNPIES